VDLQKVILYYAFTPLDDPEAIRLWQETLCRSLGLKGRILISTHGINGTLGGDMGALKKYVRQTKSYAGFKDIVFKWSDGTAMTFPDCACACAVKWCHSAQPVSSKWTRTAW